MNGLFYWNDWEIWVGWMWKIRRIDEDSCVV